MVESKSDLTGTTVYPMYNKQFIVLVQCRDDITRTHACMFTCLQLVKIQACSVC